MTERDETPDDGGNEEQETPRRQQGRHIGVLAMVLVAVLGFTIAVQIRSHGDDSLDGARTEDLVRILADLDAQRSRLGDEIAELEIARDELASGSLGDQAALERAQELADAVGILAGTLEATGRGIELIFTPGSDPISAAVLLDAVQELRGAGVEAIQINGSNGNSVRVIASTSFAESGGDLVIDGVRLTADFTLIAIGDPDTMTTALRIPGGVEDTVKKDGGTVMVRQPGTVDVTALAETAAPEYAEPVD
ncbi:MAG TPA: DUF881 domain-containing protein [Candidatus Stackebrandtia excrementipullorum]|nr:DUF881 domain-containing protein [Candidatus Stackebrandtia excrementipullorum]